MHVAMSGKFDKILLFQANNRRNMLFFLHLQFKFIKLLQFYMTPRLLISIAFELAYIPKMDDIIAVVLTVVEQFEYVEGRNPGETSIADLPGVVKSRKELCETNSVNESQIPPALLETLLVVAREYPPVCAITGGILGQVIKAISGRGNPLKNFFFFDAMDGKGLIENISEPNTGS